MKQYCVFLSFLLLFSSLPASHVSVAEDFEKMVMITCGVMITTVVCIGKCFEQWKKKTKQEDIPTKNIKYQNVMSLIETQERF